MEKYNKISSKMYNYLMQQKMQQKVDKKCNYAALLIRRFVFSKLVEFVYEYILSGLKNKYSAWIINSGCGLYFLLVWQDQNTKRNQFFNKLFYTTRFLFLVVQFCAVFWISLYSFIWWQERMNFIFWRFVNVLKNILSRFK